MARDSAPAPAPAYTFHESYKPGTAFERVLECKHKQHATTTPPNVEHVFAHVGSPRNKRSLLFTTLGVLFVVVVVVVVCILYTYQDDV